MARDLADDQVGIPNGPTPQTHLISHLDGVIPKSVTATFDGSGAAGAFLPTLIIAGKEGREVARIPAPEVAAGATAEVSWFPRGLKAAAAAGTGQATAFFDGNAPLVLGPWGNVLTSYPWAAMSTHSPAVYQWPSGGDPTKIHIAQPGVYQACYQWQGSTTAFPPPPAKILSRIVAPYTGAVVSDLSVNSANADVFRGMPFTNPPRGPVAVTTFNMQFAGDFQIQVAYTGATSYTLGDVAGFLIRLGDVVF